jgi:hypothetical protein
VDQAQQAVSMVAALLEALAVMRVLAVEQPMFAQRQRLAIVLLWLPEEAVPEDSLVAPAVQPVASLATRELAAKARVASQAPQHLVETADHQMAEAGEPVAALVLAEPAEPVQPRAVEVAVADTTVEVAEEQTSMAAAQMLAVAAEAHHGTTPH